jgi:antitoxin component of MazEF toxin-antitoxin module
MIKKLTRVGNSLAVVIDRPILELLHVDAETPLEVSTDGKTLTIAPVSEEARATSRKRQFREALAWVDKRYAKTMKKLAE